MSLERIWHQRDDQANRQSMGHLQCSWHASGTQAISQGQSLVSLEACHSTEISYGTAHLRKSQQVHVVSANQFSNSNISSVGMKLVLASCLAVI